jgi:hypothetical protein
MNSMNWLLRTLTLRCEEASELSSQELDSALSLGDRLALFGHVAVCKSCRRFRAQIRLIRQAIRRRKHVLGQFSLAAGQLSPEARHRIALAIAAVRRDNASDNEAVAQ